MSTSDFGTRDHPTFESLQDGFVLCESRWRANSDDPRALEQYAQAGWALIRHVSQWRSMADALAIAERLAGALLLVARQPTGQLAVLATRWLVQIAQFLRTKDQPQLAVEFCKAAVGALERRRLEDSDESMTILLCQALLVLADNYLGMNAGPAALEAVRYIISLVQAAFPQATLDETQSPGRQRLSELLADYARRFATSELVEATELLSSEAERIAVAVPLTLGTQTVAFVVGDALPDQQALERIVGRYELLEKLGQGAFGVVYKARDTLLERIVTLKIPQVRDLDTAARSTLLQEAKAYARCSHPNIVSVYDLGSEDGVVYLVLEYIDGTELMHWIEAQNAEPRKAIATIVSVTDALAHAHSKDILHRDIKSSNILVTEAGRAYLSDFGLAVPTSTHTSGQLVGTPLYMSPEQAQGLKVDARSDIFSFGVVLYEVTTGKRPFMAENMEKILWRISNDDPQAPSTHNREIPRDLEAIIFKCLAKEREHRYQTATELGDDLRRFLQREPVSARRYTAWERLGHALQQQRRMIAWGGLGVVILAFCAWFNISFAVPLSLALLIVLAWTGRHLLSGGQPAAAGAVTARRGRRSVSGRPSSEIVFSSQAVVTHYPAPIALAFRRFCGRANPRERLDALYFTLEAMLRYLVFLGLADLSSSYARQRPKDRAFPDRPEFEFLRKAVKMPLGMWAATLRAVVVELRNQKTTFFTELIDVCRPGGYFDEKILGALIQQRNRKLIHREGFQVVSDAEARDLAREARALLEDGLRQIDFVRLYPLGFVTDAARQGNSSGRQRYRVHSCMGAIVDTSNDAYVDEFPHPLKTATPFVVHQDQQRLLYLWPWLLEFVSEKSARESLFAFEGIATDKWPFLGETRSASIEIEEPKIVRWCPTPEVNHQWFFRQLKELPVEFQLDKDSRLYERLLPSRAAQLVGRRIAQYTIVRPLSKGNFATIYLAQDDKGAHAAIKVIEARDAALLIERFVQEFEKLKLAGNHAGVLQCFETDVAMIEGREYPWYSMEFAVGGDLFSRMLERRASHSVPWNDPVARRCLVEEFLAICDAVAHLHTLEIVHRDIKPSNVLVMDDGSLKLSDFGLVKNLRPSDQSLMQRHVTSSGAVLGTPQYMSPEQERGEKIGKQADVYALGILLAEMSSGDLPKSNSSVKDGSRIQSAKCLEVLPAGLRQVIFELTDAEPARRPADAGELLKRFRNDVMNFAAS